MATVKKRTWTTSTGAERTAWRVRYVDQHGATRTRQFDLRRDADAFRIKAEGEVAAGTHTADSVSITVGEAADIWLAAREAEGCDRGTIKSYREMVNSHIRPLIGREKLSRLTGPKVVEFRDALLATRSLVMSSKAVRHLSMILIDAHSRGLVAQNAARDVKVRRPRNEKGRLAKRAEIPPAAHLRAIIAAADGMRESDPRLGPMVRIAMLAGLRASEIRGLSWANVNLAKHHISVTQKADRWNGLREPKSAAGHRFIPIGPALVALLKAWKLQCPPSDADLVFPSRPRGRQNESSKGRTNGGPISQHAMATLLSKLEVAAKVARDSGKRSSDGETIWALRYDWHHLRHAAASNWIADGIDLKRLQVWIGHENVQLTIDVYGHLIVDAKKDATLAAGAEAALLA